MIVFIISQAQSQCIDPAQRSWIRCCHGLDERNDLQDCLDRLRYLVHHGCFRNFFFCGFELSVGVAETMILEMWQNCKVNKAMQTLHIVSFQGLNGLGNWSISIVCLATEMTRSAGARFHTMLIRTLYSIGLLIRCSCIDFDEHALLFGVYDLWFATKPTRPIRVN